MRFFPSAPCAKDIDVVQLSLVKWICWYRWIYELDFDEKPSEKTIDDDREIDSWYERKKQDLVSKSVNTASGKKGFVDPAQIGVKTWKG